MKLFFDIFDISMSRKIQFENLGFNVVFSSSRALTHMHALIKNLMSLAGLNNHSYRHAGLCLESLTSLSPSLVHVTLFCRSSPNYGCECILHCSVSQVYSSEASQANTDALQPTCCTVRAQDPRHDG